MPTGYPDYERLARSGGYLLYGVSNVTPPYNTVLFQGYVGAWPYVNLAVNVNTGADFTKIIISYFTDSTFTVNVGFRYAIRVANNFSVTQYANITEWVQIYYQSVTGVPVAFRALALYGSTAPAGQTALVSTDVPLFQFDTTIAAATSAITVPIHVQPGSAVLGVFTTAASWFVTIGYYDFASATYLRIYDVDSTTTAKGGVFAISLPDTPIQITIHNTDAAVQTFRVSLMSTP